MSTVAALGLAQGRSELGQAWTAWEAGEISLAHKLAQDALAARQEPDEANHLLCLTTFVTGDYRAALDHYRAIGSSYRRLAELNEPVVDAYVHLGAIAEALEFARGGKGIAPITVRRLEEHRVRPPKVDLAGVAVVAFADHELTEYLPAFSVEIDGQRVVAHLDTGGMYLVMGPDRAAALGIQTIKGEKGVAHLNRMRVDWSYGIAGRFVLGDAVLHNVPVAVLSTLRGESDLVILGTNILEPFLSTMDYPNRRLILSKRADASARAEHLAMLPSGGVSVPFYLWSEHCMFARGGAGGRRDLNFFVDSALVSLHPDGRGGQRQASFTSSKRKFKTWGIQDAEIQRGFFESPHPLTLGSVREDRPLMVVGAAGDTQFGGVRIDGVISHAFLKRYVWTIDFDAREYRFAERRETEKTEATVLHRDAEKRRKES